MIPSAWVYIITNKYNTILYIGVPNDLPTRLWELTKQDPKSFSARYNLYKLIYYEGYESIENAIDREKYIKGKTRPWKEELIRTMNENWEDLTEAISEKIKFS